MDFNPIIILNDDDLDERCELTFAEFLEVNKDGLDDLGEMVESLRMTGAYLGGGGACPDWTIKIASYQIGERFAEMLADDFTPDQFAEMRRRNGERGADDNSCASHDFCDANMTMLEAFEEVMKRAPGFLDGTDEKGNHSALGESDCALWNAAWDYAKAAHLSASEVGQ